MPKDKRDKIIAACKAAREAKKKAGGRKGGGGGKVKSPKKKKQAKWMRKEITFQVAKALTSKGKDDDNDDEETLPMKEDGHLMRQAAKKKLETN